MGAELSAENDRYLHRAVEEGVYPSLAEAMNEAVELLKRRDEFRRDIQAGIDEADRGELLDGMEVFRELKQRAREIVADARKQQRVGCTSHGLLSRICFRSLPISLSSGLMLPKK